MMVQRVQRRAKALGYQKLWLETEHAEGLYAKLGWKVVERTSIVGFPNTIMSIDL